MQIEHAIYTSSRNTRNEGYHVVAASPGICEGARNELVAWCPSHAGLLPEAVGLGGMSSFQLSNGEHWITRTETAGPEYSARGGTRLVTHALRIPDDILRQFANNPFTVLNAVIAGGHLDIDVDTSSPLQPITLVGRAKIFDAGMHRRCKHILDRAGLLDLLDACCSANRVAFVGGNNALPWMALALNFMPVTCRRGLSLSVGLRPITSRPFQWFHASNDVRLHRQWQRDDIHIYSHSTNDENHSKKQAETSSNAAWSTDWVTFVADCIDHDRLDELQSVIECDNGSSDLPCTIGHSDSEQDVYA